MRAIPATEQKLQEARYHLGQLGASSNAGVQRHHLSAFLSAGRSVTIALQNEAKVEYEVRFPAWFAALVPDDQALMNSW